MEADNDGGDVDLLQRHKTAESFESQRAGRQVEFLRDHHLWIAAKNQLAHPDQEISDAECRHEQDDVRLIDQRPQHQTLNPKRQHEHHADGKSERNKRGYAVLVQPDQRQRGKNDHDALGEIENA